MPLLRLLSTSLLASFIVLPAVAQSPATAPLATIITNPPAFTLNSLSATPSTTFLQSPKLNSFHFNLPKDKSTLSLKADTQPLGIHVLTVPRQSPSIVLAQTHSPCYTLRSYNFTAKDLKSPNPRPSSATDCTPASSVKLKAIEIQGIKK